VLPGGLVDSFLARRYGTELNGSDLDQAILCDFIAEGHLGRHLRRMRELYAARLAALLSAADRRLSGLLEVSPVQAGLCSAAILRNGMTSQEAERAAADRGVECMGFHRFTIGPNQTQGLLLGFGAFPEAEIETGVEALAAALDYGRNS
jgi:GntR family transcriptional regulator/MocR family aminotransferase